MAQGIKWVNGRPDDQPDISQTDSRRYLELLITHRGLSATLADLAACCEKSAATVRKHYPGDEFLSVAKHFDTMATRIDSLRKIQPARKLT